MSRLPVVVVLVALALAIGMAVPALSAEDSVAARCPRYVATLERAKGLLQRGDRDAALSALKQARDVLSACLREEAEGSEAGIRVASAAVLECGAPAPL
jgi:hypothetical protein